MVCKNSRYLNMNVNVDLYFMCFGINSQKKSCAWKKQLTTQTHGFISYESILPKISVTAF